MKARGASSGVNRTVTSDIANKPGVFLTIPIADLKIDTEYQRALQGSRVDRMSTDWSWVACGAILVALRGVGSGDYYVIDGQHRVAAAERANIIELPCLVFESMTHIDEAQGFIDVNISRKAMNVVDRYRALLVVEDPVALRVKVFLEQANRIPTVYAGNDASSIKCLDFLLTAVANYEETLATIWPLIIDICEGRLIAKKLVQGMLYLERFLSNTSLTERHWRRRLLQVGYDGLVKSIDETVAFEGKSGGAICAQGVLRGINRGLRNKLYAEFNKVETPEKDSE